MPMSCSTTARWRRWWRELLPIGAYAEPSVGPDDGGGSGDRAAGLRLRRRGLERRAAGRGGPGLARAVADRTAGADPAHRSGALPIRVITKRRPAAMPNGMRTLDDIAELAPRLRR